MTTATGPERLAGVRPLAGEALLAAWERGSLQPQPVRALALLLAGRPDLKEPDAAAMTLPERDLALLDLRRLSFGPALAAFFVCPSCGERLEFTLPTATAAAALEAAAQSAATLLHEGWSLRLRLANSADIAAAAAEPDLEAARLLLITRCVKVESADGAAVPLAALPQTTRVAAVERVSAMHEAAELMVSLCCPGCGNPQSVPVDVPTFLWMEVRHAARRLLEEVHEIAWAYGWAEDAILAMSPRRRQAYIEMVRS
jgi:predicted RNA-binding Zn-ribbon protein involved in translation (DUF1610 family)